uniref:Uncharacterized protein n=1 Tax=Nelumbo nucifera TaxID=4432 RepID=A0A822YE77_NELNU|nr:TPA_asm: hypothetical protein HUJ06_031269 [Nelumbo nucifera]
MCLCNVLVVVPSHLQLKLVKLLDDFQILSGPQKICKFQ